MHRRSAGNRASAARESTGRAASTRGPRSESRPGTTAARRRPAAAGATAAAPPGPPRQEQRDRSLERWGEAGEQPQPPPKPAAGAPPVVVSLRRPLLGQ